MSIAAGSRQHTVAGSSARSHGATEPAAAEPAEPVASERAKVEPAETRRRRSPLPDVTTHLWQTFRRELIGRIAHLRELFGRAGEGN